MQRTVKDENGRSKSWIKQGTLIKVELARESLRTIQI